MEANNKLTKKIKFCKISDDKISFNGKVFFIKPSIADAYLNEKLGEVIADKIGLLHARYHLIKTDNVEYIISEDLNDFGNFILAEDLFRENNYSEKDIINLFCSTSLNQIDECLRVKYTNARELMADVIKMYFMDILTYNFDRNIKNWGVLEVNGKPKICLLDQGNIFSSLHRNVIHSFYDSNERAFERSHENEESDQEKLYNNFCLMLDDVINFFSVSSSEFLILAKEILLNLNPEFLRKEIETIEHKYDCKFSNNLFFQFGNLFDDKLRYLIGAFENGYKCRRRL